MRLLHHLRVLLEVLRFHLTLHALPGRSIRGPSLFILQKGAASTMPAGRPRKIRSVSQMEQLWEEYKQKCDNNTTVLTEFSSKNSEFVSSKVRKPISYTIEGFCVFIGILRQTFYDTYAKDPKFSDIVSRMREECESDVRSKFESGTIPSQLSGLWMSKFGYSTKVDNADATKNNELLQSLIDLERKHND